MGGKESKGELEYRGKEEGMGPLPSRASRPRFFPFPSPSDACHAGRDYKRFSFVKAFRDAWWVTQIEIRVLKGLRRFEMRSHVKNSFFIESVAFVHFRVQERSFRL